MELFFDRVTKKYGTTLALDAFTYSFSAGIYGLLGPNGAGKSTLMNLLTTNLHPTEGSITYDGKDIFSMGKEYRRLLGFMPQQQGVYSGYTLERFLWYMATLKGMSPQEARETIPEIVKRVRLENCMIKRLGSFSGGMKQRALIAQALIGDPKIIVLDEPTAGLDPKERINVRNLIAEIAMERVVLIATHVVSDISYISKEVLLMKEGRILQAGTPLSLCKSIQGCVFEFAVKKEEFAPAGRGYKISSIREDAERLYLRVLADRAPAGKDAVVCDPDLEDVYLYHFE